ncbi:MAG: amidohydrolase family protein, partial [Acidobacteriota bacterium]
MRIFSKPKTLIIITVPIILVLVFIYFFLIKEEKASDYLVLRGGTLIDGTGSPPLSEAVVIIQGNRIQSIARVSEAKLPSGTQVTEVIDCRGKTVLPGLIDVHVHLGGSPGGMVAPAEYAPSIMYKYMKGYLISGVTAVKSAGDMMELMLDLREKEKRGELVSPRIFAVGPCFTAPGGHPAHIFKAFPPLVESATRQVTDPEVARQMVREVAAAGVDCIKAILEDGGGKLPKLPYPAFAA